MTFSRPGFLWMRLIVLAALASSALAACGSATPGATPPPSGPAPTVTVPFDLPVTIAITGHFDDQTLALLDEQIALFEEANPDVLVEVIWAPPTAAERREAFSEQLEGRDAAGDIYTLNTTWLTEFAAHGWLLPLGDYAKSGEIESGEFFPASIQASTIDGQLLALPWTVDGGLLYYRRDLLPGPPATWQEVQRVALDLEAQAGLPQGYVWQAAAYEGLTCNTLEFVWAFGGDVLDAGGKVIFDSPETRAALGQMVDLIESGASPAEVATFREAAALAAFQKGEAALMRNWSYAWARLAAADSPLAGQVGVAPLPASCLGGRILALSAYSQHPEQAFRFMAFLVGYEQQAQIALQGVQPPALEAVYRDPELLAAKPWLAALHAALSMTRPRPQASDYARLSEIIYTEVNEMLTGEQDAETTAANVQRRLAALLDGSPD